MTIALLNTPNPTLQLNFQQHYLSLVANLLYSSRLEKIDFDLLKKVLTNSLIFSNLDKISIEDYIGFFEKVNYCSSNIQLPSILSSKHQSNKLFYDWLIHPFFSQNPENASIVQKWIDQLSEISELGLFFAVIGYFRTIMPEKSITHLNDLSNLLQYAKGKYPNQYKKMKEFLIEYEYIDQLISRNFNFNYKRFKIHSNILIETYYYILEYQIEDIHLKQILSSSEIRDKYLKIYALYANNSHIRNELSEKMGDLKYSIQVYFKQLFEKNWKKPDVLQRNYNSYRLLIDLYSGEQIVILNVNGVQIFKLPIYNFNEIFFQSLKRFQDFCKIYGLKTIKNLTNIPDIKTEKLRIEYAYIYLKQENDVYKNFLTKLNLQYHAGFNCIISEGIQPIISNILSGKYKNKYREKMQDLASITPFYKDFLQSLQRAETVGNKKYLLEVLKNFETIQGKKVIQAIKTQLRECPKDKKNKRALLQYLAKHWS